MLNGLLLLPHAIKIGPLDVGIRPAPAGGTLFNKDIMSVLQSGRIGRRVEKAIKSIYFYHFTPFHRDVFGSKWNLWKVLLTHRPRDAISPPRIPPRSAPWMAILAIGWAFRPSLLMSRPGCSRMTG